MSRSKRKPSVLRDLVAGSAAGICSIFVCHPFDVIRVRLQTDVGVNVAQAASISVKNASSSAPIREYSGAIDCIKQTIQKEGMRSLYRGLAMPLAAQAAYKSVIFGTFSATSQLMSEFNTRTYSERKYITSTKDDINSKSESGSANTKIIDTKYVDRSELSPLQVSLCGACAGAVNAFIVSPVELARNRLVLERATSPQKMRYKGPIDVLRHVRATEGGLPALFQGLPVTILRDALGVAVYFSVFRALHPRTQEVFGVGDMRASLLAGGMAGISFWVVALPLDAIKTVIQTDPMLAPLNKSGGGGSVARRGIWEIGQQMAKEKRLYRGWALAFSRGVPSAAIVFSVQDRVRDMLEDV